MNPIRPLAVLGGLKLKTMIAAAAMVAMAGTAYATPVFQGRLADGTASATCEVSGDNKCAMYYYTTLDITILNDWNIGSGIWCGRGVWYYCPNPWLSPSPALGSAQDLAASAGAAQTEFTGWVLLDYPRPWYAAEPHGVDEYSSIFLAVGGSLASMQAQFDGVQDAHYWTGTTWFDQPFYAYCFNPGSAGVSICLKDEPRYVVAVRPGDVAASVPEPQTLALLGLAGVALGWQQRRRRAKQVAQ